MFDNDKPLRMKKAKTNIFLNILCHLNPKQAVSFVGLAFFLRETKEL